MQINVFPRDILRLSFLLILFIYISHINATKYEQNDESEDFIDLGIRLVGGKQDSLIADLIAQERDVLNAGHIDGVDLYHFHIRRKRNHRSKRAIEEAIEDLKRDERIEFVTVGKELQREKRGFLNNEELINNLKNLHQEKRDQQNYDYVDTSKLEMSFDDKLYRVQWYLENKGQLNTPPDQDINVVPVWLAGYSGKDVVICIVDDGLDHRHPELTDNYRPDLSYDLNDLNDPDHDPLPRTNDDKNNHGTRCAGAAVSKANNEICGVGVAYGASIAGIRILDGRITTLLEARSIVLFSNDTDIKSASWGPTDDGTTMEAPGTLVNAAMQYSVTHGRNGKGTIFVWASGNGGTVGDDCGADGYVSHRDVISIGAINHQGLTAFFHEHCPSTMAVVYAGGQHQSSVGEKRLPIAVVTADVSGKCTTSFFGTSAAAPVAAGAFALVLEANPELTYRDLMHIVAQTARIPNLSEIDDWTINGAGFHVSDKFGFGVLDVGQMIALAQNWTNVQPRYECYHESKDSVRKLKIGASVEVSIEVKECINITNIEHVVANISYSFHRRGDVKIILISPSGTESEMLSYRNPDATNKGIEHFPFMSVHHWGEYPIGTWTLRMETRRPRDQDSVKSALDYEGPSELSYFGLRIYGSTDLNEENDLERKKRHQKRAFTPTEDAIRRIYQRELAVRKLPNVMGKRVHDHLVQERKRRKQEELEEDGSVFQQFRKFFDFSNQLLSNGNHLFFISLNKPKSLPISFILYMRSSQ